MLKLYGGKQTRASIVQWYLEELGVPYEFILLDMQQGEHRKSDFLAINPIGQVPAIVEGDFKLWESGAILLYLAEKYDRNVQSIEVRSQLNQWILFANATIAPAIFIEANREKAMPRTLTSLNEVLDDRHFLMGEEFTVADIAAGSLLSYVPLVMDLDFADYPHVTDYVRRIIERPAYQQTIGVAFSQS
ncbi:MAG: glutathione S-transferase family protein [Cyanobacteria bacterium P01_E01_bin.42]